MSEQTQETEKSAPEWAGKLKVLVGSRKFWAAVVGLAMVVIKAYKPDFPLDEGQLTTVIGLLVAYILGVAIEDGGRSANIRS